MRASDVLKIASGLVASGNVRYACHAIDRAWKDSGTGDYATYERACVIFRAQRPADIPQSWLSGWWPEDDKESRLKALRLAAHDAIVAGD